MRGAGAVFGEEFFSLKKASGSTITWRSLLAEILPMFNREYIDSIHGAFSRLAMFVYQRLNCP